MDQNIIFVQEFILIMIKNMSYYTLSKLHSTSNLQTVKLKIVTIITVFVSLYYLHMLQLLKCCV